MTAKELYEKLVTGPDVLAPAVPQRVPEGRYRIFAFMGPAFLVSVGYMDPGNWGTDIAAGSDFGYKLLWVLLLSNLMAILLQTLAAKLGIVTGLTLAENCRKHYSRPMALFLWFTAEAACMATDLAEFLGAALGFYILFKIPMFPAALLTGVAVFLILALERLGYRKVEYAILGMVTTIGVCYVIEVWLSRPDWGQIAYHTFVPQIDGKSIYVAIGMIGATVMPHNVFLHSGVIQTRLWAKDHAFKKDLFRFSLLDSLFALNGAWFINSAMVIMSAAVFFQNGIPVQSIEEAHRTLTPLLGGLSSMAFAIALLFSGLSSSVTGTLAGQIVIQGFLKIKISLWMRRLITMIPALIVIYMGVNSIKVLVLSQVVLSFQLPFTIIPLILFTRNKEIMGEYANRWWVNILAYVCAVIIIGLNIYLLYQVFSGDF